MNCDFKGWRFKSFFLPMNNFLNIINLKFYKFNKLNNNYLIFNYSITNIFLLNELIWQEGLLFDFLQKKILDNWIKKFVIYSANLFNERVLFDTLIFFFLNLIIWPMHNFFIVDLNNTGGILFINIFLFLILFLFLFLIFMFLIF